MKNKKLTQSNGGGQFYCLPPTKGGSYREGSCLLCERWCQLLSSGHSDRL
nr:MAG TPA: hypothetical protein [Caudoviricetes sp.]